MLVRPGRKMLWLGAPRRGKKGKEKVEKPRKALFVGVDVGSSFVHYVVLAEDREVVYSPRPIMHFANPIGPSEKHGGTLHASSGPGE